MTGSSEFNTETWYALREFETRDITSVHYHRRHSLELSGGKAREISSAFIQGREYFRSASIAAFAVRPLLLYYGVASLSRGLALYLNPKRRESSLKKGHGLKVCDWNNALVDGLRGVGDLRVRITKGTFQELLVATGNKFYFRLNQAFVNWSLEDSIPPLGAEFTLKEIAARVPNLSDQYAAWTGSAMPSATLQSIDIDQSSGFYKIGISDTDQSTLARVFPLSEFPGRSIDREGGNLVVETKDPSSAFFAQSLGHFGIGFVAIYQPIRPNAYFSPLTGCYMLSFILGMLCRYSPTTWTNVTRAERGDAFYPFATKLLDWIESTFPLMVVDLLRGPYEFESK